MSTPDVIAQALSLKASDRYLLLEMLHHCLEKPDPEIDRVWQEEALRRVKAYDEGQPWPDEPTDKQRAVIESAAQAVLEARAQFMSPSPTSGRGCSLSDLYNPLTMSPTLVKTHQALDRAVDACYRKAAFASDAQRVEFLFERYHQLTSLLPAEKTAKARKKKMHAG